jgi:hypothetical protein
MKFILLIFLSLSFCIQVNGQEYISKRNDTTFVGKVLASDSTFLRSNTDRAGFKYFYGVHHIQWRQRYRNEEERISLCLFE